MHGWLKLHRKFRDWKWRRSPREVTVFIEFLICAAYKTTECDGYVLRPGQLLTGRKMIMEMTGLSERQVRTAIKNLQKTGEISVESDRRCSIITINNWHEYQEIPSEGSVDIEKKQGGKDVNAQHENSKMQDRVNDRLSDRPSDRALENRREGETSIETVSYNDDRPRHFNRHVGVTDRPSDRPCDHIQELEENLKERKEEREDARARDPSFQNQSNVMPIRKMAEGSNPGCAEGNVFKNNMQISDAQLAQVWNENFPEKPYRGFSFSGHQRDDFMESAGHLNTREKWQEIFDLCKKSKLNGKDLAFPATWFTLTWIIKLKNINDLLSGKYDYFNEQKSLERIKREMRENSTYEGDYEYDWSESNEFI